MSQNQQEYVIQNDEITLKDLILKFQEYFLEILRNWWVIGIAMVIMAAIMYIRARLTPSSYVSQITFMVSGGGQNTAANPVASLLGQLGGGGGTSGGANPFKVMQLSKSRKILSKVLFHSVEVMGKEDYIANHLIEYYDYKEQWADGQLANFSFEHSNVDSFSRLENRAFLQMYMKLNGNSDSPALIGLGMDEESRIYTLISNTVTEDLSIQIVKKAYETLSTYYTDRRIEPQKKNYDAIKERLDSVSKVLKNLDYSVARSQDQSYGLPDRISNVQGERLRREQQIAVIAYGEIRKNLEIADYALRSAKPFFQVIDDAISPARRVKPSTTTAIFLGIILGTFLGILFIIIRKVIRDALAQ